MNNKIFILRLVNQMYLFMIKNLCYNQRYTNLFILLFISFCMYMLYLWDYHYYPFISSFYISFTLFYFKDYVYSVITKGKLNIISNYNFNKYYIKYILNVILFMLVLMVGSYLNSGLFNTIYCESDDDNDGDDGDNTYTNSTNKNTSDNTNDSTSNNSGDNSTSNSEDKSNKDNYSINLSLNIPKDGGEKVLKIVGDFVQTKVENVGLMMGAGSALGAMGTTILKSNLPATGKLGMLAGVTTTVLGSAVAIAGVRDSIRENGRDLSMIQTNINITEVDKIPSPQETFIHSLMDTNQLTPLENLIHIQSNVNGLIIFCLIIISSLLINKYIIHKYVLCKIKDRLSNKNTFLSKYFSRMDNINDIFYSYIVIFFFIMLIVLFGINYYITAELHTKLDDYIIVHNHLKNINNNILLLGVLSLNKCEIHNRSALMDSHRKYTVGAALVSSSINNRLLNKDVNDIISEYGSYNNYLNNINLEINEEFMNSHYPEYQGDVNFSILLSHIDPCLRHNIELITRIYKLIIEYNKNIEKLVTYSDLLDKETNTQLIVEMHKYRKDILNYLNELGDSQFKLDYIIDKINKNTKNTILVEATVNFNENSETLKSEKEFNILWDKIKNLIKNDYNFTTLEEDSGDIDLMNDRIDNYLLEIEVLFLKIYSLLRFCKDFKLLGKSEDVVMWCNNYILDLEKVSRTVKFETYTTKKKVIKKKRSGMSSIISQYRDKLNVMNKELKYKISEYILNDLKTSSELELISDRGKIVEELNTVKTKIYNDHRTLAKRVQKVLNINQFVSGLCKDLNKEHIKDQIKQFKENILQKLISVDLSHDELINFYKVKESLNTTNNESILETKESSLSNNSHIYMKCKEIISNRELTSIQKEILLEEFILNYEKEFTLNIIKSMNHSLTDYKLLTRIYKHSTPAFMRRIDSFISNYKDSKYETFNKNKEDISKFGDHLGLCLMLVIEVEELMNIMFSKVIRIIGMSGGIKQTDFLTHFADELILTLKYKLKITDMPEKRNKLEDGTKEVINYIKLNIDKTTIESKLQYAQFIFEFILSEFDYIFNKENIYENKEHHIYISIKKEYLAILGGSIFNPIRLPMIAKPKIWEYSNTGKTKITSYGGYYLDEINELSKNTEIIRQNSYNKHDSELSDNLIETVNLLNSRPFEINKQILSILVEDWNNKENSLLFNQYNKIHPLSDKLYQLTSKEKREVMAHNSKYWNYSNILNIALLMATEVIYFPTYVDFRGRIYPLPNYLSYQSNDLARSLIQFKEVKNNNQYQEILNKVLEDKLYQDKSTISNTKLSDNIDYVKLYLANVYGKSKLSRQGKLRWFNNNISEMVKTYENDLSLFILNYAKISKEPFQFISCFISYYNYITYKAEIKTPILFDATCSGIQHLSALTKDIKLANLVNLRTNDKPSDFYQYCIDVLYKTIEEISVDKLEIKSKLLALNIERKWLKQSIMTVPYNVTSLGIFDKISENFDRYYITTKELNLLNNGLLSLDDYIIKYDINIFNQKIEEDKLIDVNVEKLDKFKGASIFVPKAEILREKSKKIYFTYGELITFSGLIRLTVLNVIPPFKKLKTYFDAMIVILSILGIPLFWHTPSGMRVSMSNIEMTRKKIRTKTFKKAKPISIVIPTEQINYKQIKTGLMPNFIHSLDASNIHMLIKNIKSHNLEDINLYTIHDCFASDYKNIALIELLVKHSFIELYFREDYLREVHNSLLNQITSYTTIYTEDKEEGEINNYIICEDKGNKHYIPQLPEFNWTIDENKLKKEILFNSYFIS